MTDPEPAIAIDAAFDGGNIRVVAMEGDKVDLEIARDHQSDFYQWFSFRLSRRGRPRADTAHRQRRRRGLSAGLAGVQGARLDRPQDVADGRHVLCGRRAGMAAWPGDAPLVWFAYFAPYTMEMHHDLVARTAAAPGATYARLGTSLDGQAIDSFAFGQGPKPVWLYARQHPGESMAEWWMEGALEWLASDAARAAARRRHRVRRSQHEPGRDAARDTCAPMPPG